MSKSSNQLLTEEIRSKFLEFYDECDDRDVEFYPSDIERVKEDDWFVKRFVLHHGKDPLRALRGLQDTLRWRKHFGVRELTVFEFPMEAFLMNGIRPLHAKSREGFRVVLACLGVFRKEFRELTMQVIVFYLEEFEKHLDEKGVILFDVSEAGFGNIDLDLAYKMLTQLYNHYPYRLAGMFVYGMNWMFQSAYNFVKPYLPHRASDRLVFLDGKNMEEYFELSSLDLARSHGGTVGHSETI